MVTFVDFVFFFVLAAAARVCLSMVISKRAMDLLGFHYHVHI